MKHSEHWSLVAGKKKRGKIDRPRSRKVKIDHPTWTPMVDLLWNAIRDARGWNRRRATPAWEDDFRYLHEQDGVPVETISKVLVWFCDQKKKKRHGMPPCHSGAMFRKVFGWIQDRRSEDCGSECEVPQDILDVLEAPGARAVLSGRRLDENRLGDVLLAVREWWDRAWVGVRSLGTEEVPGVRRHVIMGFLDTRPLGVSPQVLYLTYLLDLTAGWEKWNQDLNAWYPREKRFWGFLDHCCAVRWGRWMTSQERAWLGGI